jgi:hypothetical protein
MKTTFLLSALSFTANALDYRQDVMPIFKEKCYDCHSSKAKKVKGGLRLDDEKHFSKRFSKNEVVVPGDWDASYLFVTLVMPRHEKGAMPPKNKGESLTEKEIRTVAEWIHKGAKIDGEKGKPGPENWHPDRLLKFKDGRVVIEQFGEAPKVKKVEAKWEIWSNKEGKKITARFHGLVKDKVDFELKNGKRMSYPLEQLSAESQARIQGLIDSPVMMSEDD